MNTPVTQAPTRVQVLIPAAVDSAFTYRADTPLDVGTLVEVNFAGRQVIGAVWSKEADTELPDGKIKSILRVLDMPPLSAELMALVDAVAAFTLAPLGAVLQLCGLAYAAKPVKKPLPRMAYAPQLPTLSPEQALAADALLPCLPAGKENKGSSPKPILLDGVTGSGKTEVYFHAIATLLAASPTAQILVMLPEIALTHQWIARFSETFGAAPTVWHSRLTPTQRRATWQAVGNGHARVIVGARSALFLPYHHLALIVVDEEHEASYRQEDGVLYHARDMAVLRARMAGAGVILSSATPALETCINVEIGKYDRVMLPQRFGTANLPEVALIDLLNDPPERGTFLSPTAKQAMLETLARGEQLLLFLNRRGYAPLLLCRHCGHRFQCENCSAWMVVHSHKTGSDHPSSCVSNASTHSSLRCHHCDTRKPVPPVCPGCQAPAEQFAACGPGVERVYEEVRSMFSPSSLRADEFLPRITVLSSDEAIAPEQWAAIARGEIDIIIGTQMVAKGHHFPRLSLVIVVDADMGLEGADLRAGERTFQLLHQLGGRAGRGEIAGRVLIQTSQATHPIMTALLHHDREGVMRLERMIRQQGGWPPYGKLAAILLDGTDEARVRHAAQQLARSAPQDARIHVLGPTPAPLSKLRGQYRFRLLVKAENSVHLQRTLSGWMTAKKFPGIRIKIDVNPYYFL